jgi:hypothetical protein
MPELIGRPHQASTRALRRRRQVWPQALSKLPLRSFVLTLAISLVAFTLLATGTAHAGPNDFGGIAYSPSTRVVAGGAGDSQVSAESAAIVACHASGGDQHCAAYLWVENGYGSFARSDSGAGDRFGTGWGDTAERAVQEAIAVCQQNQGTACAEVATFQTSDIDANSPARGGSGPSIPPNGCSAVRSEGSYFNLRDACNYHDECYMDYGGPGVDLSVKSACDQEFVNRMLASCAARTPADRIPCQLRAGAYRLGVQGSASVAYFHSPDVAARRGPPSLN